MNENVLKLFGLRVKSIRKQHKLSQEKFAERIGVDTGTISNIETGKYLPSFPTVWAIIVEFNV